MATLFHNYSLIGFVLLEALEGLSTQRVWHGASQRGDRDRVKCARRSRAIHYKINDDVCGFHPVLTRPFNNQFIIKLVKMWPGGTPHVVVGTLKISLDRLKKKHKEFSRVLSCQ